MAGGNIKGITIEIGGDTTKLSSALSQADKALKNTQKQLSEVERSLKFDPGNTDLLKDKQVLLADKINETKNKLEALQKAQKELDAEGVDKKLKIPRLVACPHCKGTGAKDGTSFHTCQRCHGSGYVTTVQQTFMGAMQSQSVCPECNGEGKVVTESCTYCGGSGVEKKEEIIAFHIPAGVEDGMTLTLRGQGNAPRGGGVNGDLLVKIQEEKDPELIRDGNDLIYNLMLDFTTAALGGTAEVPTIGSRARVKIAAGTQPGKVLRLRGKGLPQMNGGESGDLLVNVMVYVPEQLSDTEKSAIESLKEAPNIVPTKSTSQRIFSRLRHIFSKESRGE